MTNSENSSTYNLVNIEGSATYEILPNSVQFRVTSATLAEVIDKYKFTVSENNKS